MYLSAKMHTSYKENSAKYFAIRDLFGSPGIVSRDAQEIDRNDLGIQFYISDWRHNRERDRAEALQYRGVLELLNVAKFSTDASPHGYVTFTGDDVEVSINVGYWRKANQVHNWFVQNVQGGEDECRPHDVSREQLKTLSDLCQRVLDDSELEESEVYAGTRYVAEVSVAENLLPAESGFFFGGTDYDEWYLNDLRETVAQVESALQMPEEWSFVYRSSW